MIPPEFLIIPYQLVRDPNIQSLDERVYGIIYWLTQLKGERCTASNPVLAELCCTTAKTLGNSLTRLEEGRYITRIYRDKNKKIRKEIRPLIVFTRVSSTSGTKRKVPSTDGTVPSTDGTKVPSTDGQNNNIINNSNKEYSKTTPGEEAREFFTSENKQQEMVKYLQEKGYLDAGKTIMEFMLYWTEKNKSGTKERWEMQRTFEIKRRMITWLNNDQKFNKNKTIQSL